MQVFGTGDYSMRVWLDPNKLKALELTTNDVVAAVRDQNVEVAAGQIGQPPVPKGQAFQFTVNTQGRLSNVEEFENIVVRVGDEGELVRVKDVARVELGSKSYDVSATFNGKATCAMGIYQLPGANAIEVAEGVRAKIDELSRVFPEGLEYTIAYDSTKVIRASVEEVVVTLFITLVLVVLTVYLFLQNFRATLIPAVTIPVSLIGTFAVMAALGYSINQLTLFGLVLVIGIVVDDAIVVVENVTRHLDEGETDAKRGGAEGDGGGDRTGHRDHAGPARGLRANRLPGRHHRAAVPTVRGHDLDRHHLQLDQRAHHEPGAVRRAAAAHAEEALHPLPLVQHAPGAHHRRLSQRRPRRPAGGGDRADRLHRPHRPRGLRVRQAAHRIRAPGGRGLGAWSTSSFRTAPRWNAPMQSSIGSPQSSWEPTARRTSSGSEATRSSTAPFASNAGTVVCTFIPWSERSAPGLHQNALLEKFNAELAQIQEAVVIAFPTPSLPGLGAAGGFALQLQDRGGTGLRQLEAVANEFVEDGNAQSGLSRMFTSFRANIPQLFVEIDREQVRSLDIPLQDVFSTLQAYLGSVYVNDFTRFGRIYQVRAQAESEYRLKPDDILQLEVRAPAGGMIPLGSLMTVKEVLGPQTVFHHNIYPSAKISGQPAPGYTSGQAMQILSQMADQKLPPSMGYEWTDLSYQENKASGQAAVIFLFSIILVYLVLAAQYESWTIPVSVCLAVPTALLGAVAALMIRQIDNNVYTQIGVVLLIGLSAKTSILIVEFAKVKREEGLSVVDAALEASRIRFRAVLMTAFSFILGVIPLLVASGAGAESRQAIGTTVFGGMLVATVVSVVSVPVLYRVIQGVSEKLRGVPAAAPAKGPSESGAEAVST